jgi:small subunit ribosomal protein S5
VDPAKYLKTVKADPEKPFDLAAFHPWLDIHPENYITANESTRIVMVNPTFPRPSPETIAFMKASSQDGSANSDPLAALAAHASLRFGVKDLRQLHRYPLVVHRVVNMTSKGKMPSIYALVVVGNGKGLVGFGEGKDDTAPAASDKAFVQAVKNMDWVQRKDDRTTWASEMIGKWGSTTVELRSRPPGAL